MNAVLSALGSRSAGLSALFSRMRTCVSHIPMISLAACGCCQLRECGSGGGVPIVSYLVDECRDFIGEGGEGGGKRTIPTVRNLQRKSWIVRDFLGSSLLHNLLHSFSGKFYRHLVHVHQIVN